MQLILGISITFLILMIPVAMLTIWNKEKPNEQDDI
jgi:hypothetical protein